MSSRTRRRTAVVLGALCAVTAGVLGGGAGTYAAFSDTATLSGNSATAAVWQQNPLAACGKLSAYVETIYVTGTAAVDIQGETGNSPRPRLIIVLSDATVRINANNGDCILTGPGTTKTTTVYRAGKASAIILRTGHSLCSDADLSSSPPPPEPEDCRTPQNKNKSKYPFVDLVTGLTAPVFGLLSDVGGTSTTSLGLTSDSDAGAAPDQSSVPALQVISPSPEPTPTLPPTPTQTSESAGAQSSDPTPTPTPTAEFTDSPAAGTPTVDTTEGVQP